MNTDSLLTLKDVAIRLRVSVRAVYRLIAAGTLPNPVKVGRASRIPESDLAEYLEELKRKR